MKTIKRTFLAITLISLFSTIAFAQYDDVYYDPNEDYGTNQSGDFEEDFYNDNDPVQDYRDGYGTEEERFGDPSYTESYYDEEGNTYVTNNYYDDYYDYSYSSRLRRFYDPYAGFGFFADCYTNSWFYNYDPFFYGTNIYVTTGWWRPRLFANFGWGWGWRQPRPIFSYYQPFFNYPFYPSPAFGFNPYFGYNPFGYWNGFNNGYFAGYYDGWFGNPYNPYFCPVTGVYSPGYTANGNIYYGPRNNGRVVSNTGGSGFDQNALNTKSEKMGTAGNPGKTGNQYGTTQTSNPLPVKGVKGNSNTTVKNPTGNDSYVKSRESDTRTIRGGESTEFSKERENTKATYSTPRSSTYSKPKSTNRNTKSGTYSNPTYSPTKGNRTYSTPKRNSSYSTPKSNSNFSKPNYSPSRNYSKPKSSGEPVDGPSAVSKSSASKTYTKPSRKVSKGFSSSNGNRSAYNNSSNKTFKAPKSSSFFKSSSGSSKSYSSPKSNYSSGRTYSSPKMNYSSGRSRSSGSFKSGSSGSYSKSSSKFGKR